MNVAKTSNKIMNSCVSLALKIFLLWLSLCKYGLSKSLVPTPTTQSVYNKYISSTLPTNYHVFSLNDVVAKLFGFNLTVSHRLTKFQYTNSTLSSPKTVVIGDNSTFMLCGVSSEVGATGYFCIDKKTSVVRTTVNYQPPVDHNELITLFFEVNCKIATGVMQTENYEVAITIQETCNAQVHVYEELRKCRPSVSAILTGQVTTYNVSFNLVKTDIGKAIWIDTVELNTSLMFNKTLQINDDSSNILFIKLINSTSYNIAVDAMVTARTSTLTIKLYDEASENIELSNAVEMTLKYFAMNNFCNERECLTSLYYWMVGNITAEDISCVSDTERLTKLFNLCYNTCWSGTSESSDGDNVYNWPATINGETAYSLCPGRFDKFAARKCLRANGSTYADWKPHNESACVSTVDHLTDTLEVLLMMQITVQNAASASQKLRDISTTSVKYTSYDAYLVTTSVEKFLDYLRDDKEVENNVMTTVDYFLNIDKDVLSESEDANETTTRMLNFLGNAGEVLAKTVPYVVNRKKFALGGYKLRRNQFNGLTVDTMYKTEINELRIHTTTNTTLNHNRNANAVIYLPRSIFDKLPTSVFNLTVVVVTYATDILFPRSNIASQKYPGTSWNLNTHILGAEVRGQVIQNLTELVMLEFKSSNFNYQSHDKRCVYWKSTKRIWTDTDCWLNISNNVNNMHRCTCNHLTNFAMLFNANPPADGDNHGEVLTVVTYIGLTISLIGAALTLLTHAIFPILRATSPPKILMNLCSSLILMIILFFVGVERTSSETSCKVIAIVLQYFLLTVFSWCAVEGFHSARGLVFPMKPEVNMFIQKALLFGWGVPLIFTAIGASIWYSDYGREKSCVVTGKPFFITVLIPISAVLLFNIISLLAILTSLKGSSKKYTTHAITPKDRLRIVVAFMVLFGITWAIGILVVISDNLFFQYLFCILSGLQGLYIFLFYCVRNKKIRKFCYELMQGKNIKEIQRSSTRRKQRPRAGTLDSSVDNSTSKSREYKMVDTKMT